MQFHEITLDHAAGTTPADGIRVLTLNRPDVMNAMNTRMFTEMRDALRLLAYEDGLRVLIFAGAGRRAFSAGGDLKERKGMTDAAWRAQHQLIEETFLAVKDFPLPVIAAVEGHAHGGGLELALMTDFIVGSQTAVFSLAEAKRGILPGGGGIQNMIRAVGSRRAKQLIFTGMQFSASQAFEWGVLNELVEAGAALDAAVKISHTILDAAPMSVRYGKLAASRGGEVDFHTGYALDLAAYNVLVSSKDRYEGVLAFNERRKPHWSNS
jgi:enoyl-CoA hydratase